jgi:hypothetical protein
MSRQTNEVIQQRIIVAINSYCNYLNNPIILIDKLSMMLINKLNIVFPVVVQKTGFVTKSV